MPMTQERIYHIMIDRFYPMRGKDKEGNFKGGCFRSVINHLDYIRGLSMTGIMLTPFYKTAAYHGYHVVDFEEIDPHFGTKKDMKELACKVHERNMSIVADFVANHCHKSCRLFADGKYKDWFLFKSDGTYRSFAGIADLHMFNTGSNKVQVYLTKRVLDLCAMGFDAIRFDHATGPSYSFWSFLRKSVKKQYPNVKLIGEVWGGGTSGCATFSAIFLTEYDMMCKKARQLEYVGILDGMLDFRYQQLLCKAANRGKLVVNNHALYNEVKTHFARYPTDFQLWLFLDNHDLNRFPFEYNGGKKLLKEGIEFSKQWNRPWLMSTEQKESLQIINQFSTTRLMLMKE